METVADIESYKTREDRHDLINYYDVGISHRVSNSTYQILLYLQKIDDGFVEDVEARKTWRKASNTLNVLTLQEQIKLIVSYVETCTDGVVDEHTDTEIQAMIESILSTYAGDSAKYFEDEYSWVHEKVEKFIERELNGEEGRCFSYKLDELECLVTTENVIFDDLRDVVWDFR